MPSFEEDVKAATEEEVAHAARADLQIAKLRTKLREEKAKAKFLAGELEQAEARNTFASSIAQAPTGSTVISSSNLGRHEATPVIMCSDWHAEESVDPATVNGRNEYNPEIFKKRSENLTKGVLWHIENSPWKVNSALLWLGGDLISGHIHEELLESNHMSPTRATLLVQDAVVTMIRSLLAHKRIKRVDVVCNDGNHGRTTPKRRVSTRCDNSFEWLMYQQLRRLFSGDKRVSWNIASGSHTYADIYDTRIRFIHGDECRYGGGVGGIGIPLRKAIDAWNSNMRADATVMGHWHQLCMPHPDIIVNGSLIGWNAFAQSIKARFEKPRQGLFFVSKRWGIRGLEPIYVEGE